MMLYLLQKHGHKDTSYTLLSYVDNSDSEEEIAAQLIDDSPAEFIIIRGDKLKLSLSEVVKQKEVCFE